MSDHKKPPEKIERELVLGVSTAVMAARVAAHPDMGAIDDASLASIADVSIRAAIELDAAAHRAEDRLKDQAKAAEEAEAAAVKAEADAKKVEAAAVKTEAAHHKV